MTSWTLYEIHPYKVCRIREGIVIKSGHRNYQWNPLFSFFHLTSEIHFSFLFQVLKILFVMLKQSCIHTQIHHSTFKSMTHKPTEKHKHPQSSILTHTHAHTQTEREGLAASSHPRGTWLYKMNIVFDLFSFSLGEKPSNTLLSRITATHSHTYAAQCLVRYSDTSHTCKALSKFA